MKTRISRLLVWISILLITVLCFASCDALQGAISKGMLNKEKLFDGKTPKDLYGSSINKYKNKKDDGLPYRIEAEWYAVSAPNALTKAEIVYIGDDFYCGIWDSSDDKIESEAITFKNNNMYHVAKDGSKHKNKSDRNNAWNYVEESTKVKEILPAFPDHLPESWFDSLEFNLTDDGSYEVTINVDEKKSKDHGKYSDFYQPGSKCKLYFADNGDLKTIVLENVDAGGIEYNITIKLSWGEKLKIEDPESSFGDKHEHKYEPIVTEPDCQHQGYTTYTCNCGESYVGDYVDAKEHSYVYGECKWCHALRKSEGLEYTLSKDKTYYAVSGIGLCTDADIVIPEVYNELPVTEIAMFAFRECKSITNVLIPDSIVKIGWYAFYSCENLENVFIGDGVSSIENIAFSRCKKLKSINVDENNSNYKSIDGNLYTKDGKVFIQYAIGKENTEFVLSDDVEKIDLWAFSECVNLKSVVLTDNVKEISDGIFLGCEALTDVILPKGMTAITYEMFYACQSLKSIVIPEGVTKIESCAFDNCKNLESVVIPSSVKEIGECAFGLSEKLNAVYYLGSENDWESIYIDDYGKEPLDCAVRYYYSKNEPTTEGNFWYYDENSNIVIW